MLPFLSRAVVLAQDPDNYRVYVGLLGGLGGQGPTMPVEIGTGGPRDAVRGNYGELPTIGTHGLVGFTSGDNRNGVWICSTRPSLTDASAHSPGMGGLSYAARYSGAWEWQGPDGTTAMAWPDGTTILLGGSMPAPTRHTLDASQMRVRTPFTAAERTPKPPSPFPLTVVLAAGAAISVDVSGNVSVTGAGNVSVAASGTVSLTSTGTASIASSGAVTIRAASTVTASAGGATQAVKLASGANSAVFFTE